VTFGIAIPEQPDLKNGSPTSVVASAKNYGPPVQTVAELRAVPAINREDKQQRLVEDKGVDYRFDAQGVGADDGDLIIVPTTGTGRWFKTATPAGGVPGAHALGGIAHTSDTLANLNSKISDATLDVFQKIHLVGTSAAFKTALQFIIDNPLVQFHIIRITASFTFLVADKPTGTLTTPFQIEPEFVPGATKHKITWQDGARVDLDTNAVIDGVDQDYATNADGARWRWEDKKSGSMLHKNLTIDFAGGKPALRNNNDGHCRFEFQNCTITSTSSDRSLLAVVQDDASAEEALVDVVFIGCIVKGRICEAKTDKEILVVTSISSVIEDNGNGIWDAGSDGNGLLTVKIDPGSHVDVSGASVVGSTAITVERFTTLTKTLTGSQDLTAGVPFNRNILAAINTKKIARARFWISEKDADVGLNVATRIQLKFFNTDGFLHAELDTVGKAGLIEDFDEFQFVSQNIKVAPNNGDGTIDIDDTADFGIDDLVRIHDGLTDFEFQRVLAVIDPDTLDLYDTILKAGTPAWALDNDVTRVLEIRDLSYRDQDDTDEVHLRMIPRAGDSDCRLHWWIEYERAT
jgi:hypothetical protein